MPNKIRYRINKRTLLPEFVVYKLTFPNGKLYIGSTKYYEERIFEHERANKATPKLSRAILKYGWKNVKHEIILKLDTHKEMLEKETEIIKFYDTVAKGYNCTSGGEGSIMSEETLEKQRKIQGSPEVRERKSRIGKELMKNPEYKAKAINNLTNYINSDMPSKHSKRRWEEDKEFMEKTLASMQTPEAIQKRKDTMIKQVASGEYFKNREHLKDGWKKKRVICIETRVEYTSVKECYTSLGVAHCYLIPHLKGRTENCKGLHYKYMDEV